IDDSSACDVAPRGLCIDLCGFLVGTYILQGTMTFTNNQPAAVVNGTVVVHTAPPPPSPPPPPPALPPLPPLSRLLHPHLLPTPPTSFTTASPPPLPPPPPVPPSPEAPPAPPATVISSTITFADLDYDSLVANASALATFEASFQAQLAAAAGVSTDRVIIDSVQSGSTQVTSQVEFTASSSGDAASLQSTLMSSPADLFPDFLLYGAISASSLIPMVPALSYEEEEEEEEERYRILASQQDIQPPTIWLYGDRNMSVLQLEVYIDAGATAIDDVDGDVAVRIDGLDAVDTSSTTPPAAPFVVRYTAVDTAGNEAMVERQVAVISPCATPSALCADTGECSSCLDTGECTCSLSTVTLLPSSEAIVETYVPPEDTDPPQMTLLGDGAQARSSRGVAIMVHHLDLNAAWADPGVQAWDEMDGNLTASRYGAMAVDVTRETLPDDPYVITYKVADAVGNEAMVRRHVYVSNPCDDGEAPCSDGACSTEGLCLGLMLEDVLVEDSSELETATGLWIRLRGPETIEVAVGETYTACPPNPALTMICDHGAEGGDDGGDGDLTAQVRACSRDGGNSGRKFADAGLAPCQLDTSTPGQTNISFTVRNSVGVVLEAVRLLVVTPQCPAWEKQCSSHGSCSTQGVCVEDLAGPEVDSEPVTVDAAPVVTLIVTDVVGAFVAVGRNNPYAACTAGETPSEARLCEPGVMAVDDNDGDVTNKVLSCPPQECLEVGCPGHEFAVKGIEGCLSTEAAVGTIFEVEFLVFDSAIPPNSARATRTVTIVAPCAEEHHYCEDDDICTAVTCAEYLELEALLGEPSDTAAPELSLLGHSALVLEYGQPMALSSMEGGPSLLPCAAYTETEACYAVAWDEVDGDVTSSIEVAQVRHCSKQSSPPSSAEDTDDRGGAAEDPGSSSQCSAAACALESLARGECPPGKYEYEYRVEDAAGNARMLVLEAAVTERAQLVGALSLGADSETTAVEMAAALEVPASPEAAAFVEGVRAVLNENAEAGAQEVRAEDVHIVAASADGTSVLVEYAVDIRASPGGEDDGNGDGSGGSSLHRRLQQICPPDTSCVLPLPPSQPPLHVPPPDFTAHPPLPAVPPPLPPPSLPPLQSPPAPPVLADPPSLSPIPPRVPLLDATADHAATLLAGTAGGASSLGDSLTEAAGKANTTLGAADAVQPSEEASTWHRETPEVDDVAVLEAQIQGEVGQLQRSLEKTSTALEENGLPAMASAHVSDGTRARNADAALATRAETATTELLALQEDASALLVGASKLAAATALMEEQREIIVAAIEATAESMAGAAADEAPLQTGNLLESSTGPASDATLSASLTTGGGIAGLCEHRPLNGRIEINLCVGSLNCSSYPPAVAAAAATPLASAPSPPPMGIGARRRWLLGAAQTGMLVGRQLLARKKGGDAGAGSEQTDAAGLNSLEAEEVIDEGRSMRLDPRPERKMALRNTVIGGVTMRQQRRQVTTGRECTARFVKLAAPCLTVTDTSRFGADPVFKPTSPLYLPSLQEKVGEYYDTRPGSEQVVRMGTEEVHRALPFAVRVKEEHAFPVHLAAGVSRTRAFELLQYLKQGSFYDEKTDRLDVELVMWNAEGGSDTLSKISACAQRDSGGAFRINLMVTVLPCWSLPSSTGEWLAMLFQLSMAVMILLQVYSHMQWMVYRNFHRLQMQMLDLKNTFNEHVEKPPSKLGHSTTMLRGIGSVARMSSSLLRINSRSSTDAVDANTRLFKILLEKPEETADKSPLMRALDTVSIWLQFLALVLLVAYIVMSSTFEVAGAPHFDVYHDNYALAHFLLPATQAIGVAPLAPAALPWELPEDPDGYRQLKEMMSAIDDMTALQEAYWVIQMVNIMLLLVRLLAQSSFQEKLGYVSFSLSNDVESLAAFLFVVLYIYLMLGGAVHMVFGTREEVFSTSQKSMMLSTNMLIDGSYGAVGRRLLGATDRAALVGSKGHMTTTNLEMTAAVLLLVLPALMSVIILSMLLAHLSHSYMITKVVRVTTEEDGDGEDLMSDLAFLLKQWILRVSGKRVSVKRLLLRMVHHVGPGDRMRAFNAFKDRIKASTKAKTKTTGLTDEQWEQELFRMPKGKRVSAREVLATVQQGIGMRQSELQTMASQMRKLFPAHVTTLPGSHLAGTTSNMISRMRSRDMTATLPTTLHECTAAVAAAPSVSLVIDKGGKGPKHGSVEDSNANEGHDDVTVLDLHELALHTSIATKDADPRSSDQSAATKMLRRDRQQERKLCAHLRQVHGETDPGLEGEEWADSRKPVLESTGNSLQQRLFGRANLQTNQQFAEIGLGDEDPLLQDNVVSIEEATVKMHPPRWAQPYLSQKDPLKLLRPQNIDLCDGKEKLQVFIEAIRADMISNHCKRAVGQDVAKDVSKASKIACAVMRRHREEVGLCISQVSQMLEQLEQQCARIKRLELHCRSQQKKQ
ncbi:hypothetical protein CYMTET_28429, partial [Cymbomonas tetramitiformis]